MYILKRAFAVLITLAALLLCVWSTRFLAVDHLGYSIAVNFLFMAVFTLFFDSLLKPSFTSGYFDSRRFERDGAIYQWFGVKYYVYLLRLIGWERMQRRDRPINTDLNSLRKYETTTRGAEAAHLLGAVCVIALTIWAAWTYSLGHIHWLVLSNVLLNVYPVLLQRYNRPRVSRLISFKETHSSTASETE